MHRVRRLKNDDDDETNKKKEADDDYDGVCMLPNLLVNASDQVEQVRHRFCHGRRDDFGNIYDD